MCITVKRAYNFSFIPFLFGECFNLIFRLAHLRALAKLLFRRKKVIFKNQLHFNMFPLRFFFQHFIPLTLKKKMLRDSNLSTFANLFFPYYCSMFDIGVIFIFRLHFYSPFSFHFVSFTRAPSVCFFLFFFFVFFMLQRCSLYY